MTPVLRDEIAHDFSIQFYGLDGSRFVGSHQSTVSCGIGTEDGGKFAVEGTLRHSLPPGLILTIEKVRDQRPEVASAIS